MWRPFFSWNMSGEAVCPPPPLCPSFNYASAPRPRKEVVSALIKVRRKGDKTITQAIYLTEWQETQMTSQASWLQFPGDPGVFSARQFINMVLIFCVEKTKSETRKSIVYDQTARLKDLTPRFTKQKLLQEIVRHLLTL